MEGIERMQQPEPERDLESQTHRETSEDGERREVLAAIARTLSAEEKAAFFSIAEPGISYEESTARKQAFNELRAGVPDTDENVEERKHDNVEINIAGTILSVSRDDRGRFSIA